jgi:hypothetical protein
MLKADIDLHHFLQSNTLIFVNDLITYLMGIPELGGTNWERPQWGSWDDVLHARSDLGKDLGVSLGGLEAQKTREVKGLLNDASMEWKCILRFCDTTIISLIYL